MTDLQKTEKSLRRMYEIEKHTALRARNYILRRRDYHMWIYAYLFLALDCSVPVVHAVFNCAAGTFSRVYNGTLWDHILVEYKHHARMVTFEARQFLSGLLLSVLGDRTFGIFNASRVCFHCKLPLGSYCRTLYPPDTKCMEIADASYDICIMCSSFNTDPPMCGKCKYCRKKILHSGPNGRLGLPGQL